MKKKAAPFVAWLAILALAFLIFLTCLADKGVINTKIHVMPPL